MCVDWVSEKLPCQNTTPPHIQTKSIKKHNQTNKNHEQTKNAKEREIVISNSHFWFTWVLRKQFLDLSVYKVLVSKLIYFDKYQKYFIEKE